MILTLYTEGFFDAAHYLRDYEGKCSRLHGHTWKVCLWVRGEETLKSPNGILWDFGNLKKVLKQLDHATINEVMKDNPTAENIALYIYQFFKQEDPGLEFRVRVYENFASKHSYCETGEF